MHGQRIYFSDQNLNPQLPINAQGTISNFQYHFKEFLSEFNRENVRIYHKQIGAMLQQRKYYVTINLSDLKEGDDRLYQQFIYKPLKILGVMEQGVKEYVLSKKGEFSQYDGLTPWQVCIRSDQRPKRLRDVESSLVNKIFVINGIIISCTKPYIKASELRLKCKNCQLVRKIAVEPGQFPYIPMVCPGQNGNNQRCPPDPYVPLPQSQVIDYQNMKIQQHPQQIPTGQIARTYSLICDRFNVNKCVPGDRVRITGMLMINSPKAQTATKGNIYVTGIQKMKQRTHIQYTTDEEELFKKLSKDPQLYNKIYKSIAPGIYGNQQIKKAIACMLFGGSRKCLPDRTILRGDINILLIGDPSTAKSQFLKFVEQTAAIAVYTSGKGSSAAGLTASINKDPITGQFQIQGGALVLADGGIVCIDQFDKMKAADRVAIHQAMEQQTISVAKAGITTRLNSRASVLAAANPIKGSYDTALTASEQMQLQQTILSRFDCIFIVLDINTEQSNDRIAKHILQIHQGKLQKQHQGQIPFDLLKKYISYARSKINPRMNIQACQKLSNTYISDRQKAQDQKLLSKNAIPITVRQLEAVIRLSQALAKMKLKSQVTADEVDEAHYLFEISTMKAIQGKQLGYNFSQVNLEQTEKIQQLIKKRVNLGSQAAYLSLVNTLSGKFSEQMIAYTIDSLVKKKEFRKIKNGRSIIRDA